ncbi:VOC family protein [Nocardioides speluncae]|uniref:VOC family protein n=1 Tax=Nocardioides speluncae TaxID=2670337 RepID=UPI000D69C278|nr:VOC family protein [Nocardioides speluncae]
MARFRYIVHDVDQAIVFYERLGFTVEMHPGPGFAMLRRDDLQLALNVPGGGGGAGQAMPDGTLPEPGGWSRIMLEVDDVAAEVDRLAGATFRSGVIEGRGVRQVIVEDPSGNAVELFTPLG